VRYERTSRLLQSLELAHADGSYPQLLRTLARTPLLICDDWLRDPLSRSQARDLLEILDDRYGRSATVVVTQVPVAEWHSRVPDPTLSDAILDRLIHNAYRLELEGESMRKVHSPLHTNDI
jgi:DNA replication protein DnaC